MEYDVISEEKLKNRKRSSKKCEKHPKRRIISLCETCHNDPVCKKCLKTAHHGHELRNITDGDSDFTDQNGKTLLLPQARLLTSKDIPELRTDTEKKEHYVHNETKEMIRNIDKNLQSIVRNKKSLKSETDLVIENMRRQAKLMKQQIDSELNRFEKKCRHLERTQNELFSAIEHSLASYSRRLRKCDKESKEDASDFNELKSEIKQCKIEIEKILTDHDELLSKIMVHKFEPAQVSSAEYEDLFGDLCETELSLSSEDRLEMLTESYVVPSRTTSPQEFPVQIISRFSFGDEVVRSICPVKGGHSWIVREKQSLVFTDVQLTKFTGEQDENQMAVVFDTGVLDMTSDNNDVKITCCTDNTVREILDDGHYAVLYQTSGRPESLCMLSNAAVVVCFYKKGRVIKFGHKGRILNFIERDGNGVGFLTHPFRVRANKNNDHVAVLNADPYALIVLDKHLHLQFVYNGTLMDSLQVKRKGGILTPSAVQIGPNDVCFDTYDNIFVTDVISKSVIMLDPCGHFVARILPGQVFPSAVAVDSIGQLWVGYYNGVIQVIKYTDGEREIQ